jgi:Mg2+ and Co2+ transporter CorA
MNLESIDEAAKLRDDRARVETLFQASRSGSLGSFTIWSDGEEHKVAEIIPIDLITAAVARAADLEINRIDEELRRLGVAVKERQKEEVPTEKAYNLALADVEMYRKAWIRTLGGKLLPKRHLIDALCLTTEEMVRRATRYGDEPMIPKAEHDRRVTELLEHNNTMEQRMREAERRLKRFMESTPAERLAFAVEQAAASTIAAIKQEVSRL